MDHYTRHVDEWRNETYEVLQSKVDELKLLGYDGVNAEEIWTCLLAKVWKKEKRLRLHQVIQDILHLSGSTYMSYLTVEAQKQANNDDLFQQIGALEVATEEGQH